MGADSAVWVRDPGGTAMSREAKSQENTGAVPVGADSAVWVRDPGGTAMSREAKSQRTQGPCRWVRTRGSGLGTRAAPR